MRWGSGDREREGERERKGSRRSSKESLERNNRNRGGKKNEVETSTTMKNGSKICSSKQN